MVWLAAHSPTGVASVNRGPTQDSLLLSYVIKEMK